MAIWFFVLLFASSVILLCIALCIRAKMLNNSDYEMVATFGGLIGFMAISVFLGLIGADSTPQLAFLLEPVVPYYYLFFLLPFTLFIVYLTTYCDFNRYIDISCAYDNKCREYGALYHQYRNLEAEYTKLKNKLDSNNNKILNI